MAKRKSSARKTDTKKVPTEPSTEDPLSFEDALTELQHVVEDLETGRLGLEESLSRFEQGMTLLRSCYSRLNQAEQRVEILTSADEDEISTAPFDTSSTASTSTIGQASANPKDSKDGTDSEQALF